MANNDFMNRAAGAVIGSALGDMIGAPYEFTDRILNIRLTGSSADILNAPSSMWEHGEWTDDTSMAVPILQALAHKHDLNSSEALEYISDQWVNQWAPVTKDIGVQTAQVFRQAKADSRTVGLAGKLITAASVIHEKSGRSAGNGSVMRTAPVAIFRAAEGSTEAHRAFLEAADRISGLTHHEKDGRSAAVVWASLIRSAICEGTVPTATEPLPYVEEDITIWRWSGLLKEASISSPTDFPNNGWSVHAVQAAYAAVHKGGIVLNDRSTHSKENFIKTIEAAVNIVNDTDTVAAIAGGLAGALVGYSNLPEEWLSYLHGWPGYSADDLYQLSKQALA